MSPISSGVWNHFEKIANSKNVRCTIPACNKELKRNDSSTTSMWVHLNCLHHAEYEALRSGDNGNAKAQNKREMELDEIFLIDDESKKGKCLQCGTELSMCVKTDRFRNLRRHAQLLHNIYFASQLRCSSGPTIICPFCFKSRAIKNHIQNWCAARRIFQEGGVGLTLRELSTKNMPEYQEALLKFQNYVKAVQESANKVAVYLAFERDANRARRVLYVGQTTQGEHRWNKHIADKNRKKNLFAGRESVTFCWVETQLSKQSANSLEAATQMLVTSMNKMRIHNARFDGVFLASHPTLGNEFKEAVDVQLKAASLLIINALKNVSGWKTFELDAEKQKNLANRREKRKREEKTAWKAAKYNSLLAAFKEAHASALEGKPLNANCPSPSQFESPSLASSQQSSDSHQSVFSDAPYTLQEIVDHLILPTDDPSCSSSLDLITTSTTTTTSEPSTATEDEKELC